MEAIQKTAEAGGKVIEFYPGQKLGAGKPDVKFDHNAGDETIALVKAQLEKSGIRAVNYGVVEISKDAAGARKVFEFAKKIHLSGITTESVSSIETIEKLVKEYAIHAGFHNHPRQPLNPFYKNWDPNYILSVVLGRDPRIGATADTGHWLRSGLDPMACLKILEGRIVSVHLKDLNKISLAAHDVPFGTGMANIPAILEELKRQGFDGSISIEYEYHWKNNVPEVARCVGFVRGQGASIRKTDDPEFLKNNCL
jgi:sugar phosphate isomerase/epimerase